MTLQQEQKEQEVGISIASKTLRRTPSVAAHAVSERVHIITPLASSGAVQKNVERLKDVASGLADLLTDTTEQAFHLRAALSGVVEDLRNFGHNFQQGRAFSGVSRLAVTGARQTGKSSLVQFLVERSLFASSVDGSTSRNDDDKETGSCMSVESSLCHERSFLVFFENHTAGGSPTLDSGITVVKRRESPPKTANETTTAGGGVGTTAAPPLGGSILSPKVSGTKSDVHFSARTSCSEVGGITFEAASTLEASCSPQTVLQLLRERSRRRLPRGRDLSRSGPSFRHVVISPHLESRHSRPLEPDLMSPTLVKNPKHCFRIFSGNYNLTIVDRMRMEESRSTQRRSLQTRENGARMPIFSPRSANVGKMQNLSPSLISSPKVTVEFPREHQASSWTLHEMSGSDIWSSKRERSFSCQLPDSLRGEAFILTIPCEVVGTNRLMTHVAELFGRFGPHIFSGKPKDASSVGSSSDDASPRRSLKKQRRWSQADGSEGDGSKKAVEGDAFDNNVRSIRQMIADMTFFFLTFSDAVLSRADGVVTLDKQLLQRPPPMASSLPELVVLFQRDMQRFFCVQVASWQVIPFSGTMSHVTRDVLVAMHAGNRLRLGGNVEKSNAEVSSSPKNAVSLPGMDNAPKLQVALHNYCDVVYGQCFKERKDTLSSEQLEKMVRHHALTSMWDRSGASQLVQVAQIFEWCAGLHFLSRIAVSLVIWCFQLGMVLQSPLKLLSARIKGVRGELGRAERESAKASWAIKRLIECSSPLVMAQRIQFQLQEQFEVFTITFWWDLLDFLTAEDNAAQRRNTTPPHPEHLSPHLVEARERLLKHYRLFLRLYVERDYPAQILQLQRIIAEEERCHGESPSCIEATASSDLLMATSEFRLESLRSTGAVTHHIPLVAKMAREFKATMEKELTMHLARFNTEVINYFMAEMAAALPAFVAMCDEQRNTAKKVMLEVAAALNCRGGYDLMDRNMLRHMLWEISRIRLVEFRPTQELESLVTGMRSALCEDQILLILKGHGKEKTDSAQKKYAARTLKYIAKCECNAKASQNMDVHFAHLMNVRPLQQMREHSGAFLASTEPEDVAPLPGKWLRKSAGIPRRRKASLFATATATAAAAAAQSCLEEHEELPKPGEICHGQVDSSSPAWFLLAVWQEALSSLSFRPWLLLHSPRYSSLLNNMCLIFLKEHARLDGVLKEDIHELKASLSRLRKEAGHVEVEIPAALTLFASTASDIARELTDIKAGAFTAAAPPMRNSTGMGS